MLLKIAVALAAVPLAALATVAGTGVVVVDVKEAGGSRIVVPVPLLLVETAVRLSPGASAARFDVDRHLGPARPYLPAAVEAIDALAEGPDGELVSVDEGDEHVRISKVGDALQIRVEGPREDVSVNVPLRLVRDAVRQARDGRITPGDLVGALRQARLTRIVDVRDGDDHVTITVW